MRLKHHNVPIPIPDRCLWGELIQVPISEFRQFARIIVGERDQRRQIMVLHCAFKRLVPVQLLELP